MYTRYTLDCALIAAVKRLDVSAVKHCLAQGARPDAGDPETRAPLWWRALAHLSNQAAAASDGDPALLVVFARGFERTTKAPANQASGAHAPEALETTEIVRLLLKSGANANVQITQGQSAIACAQWLGYKTCVRILLEHGARAEETAFDGNTLLTCSIGFDDFETTQELVRHGANVNTRDKNGVSPFVYANLRGNPQVIRFLTAAGAHP